MQISAVESTNWLAVVSPGSGEETLGWMTSLDLSAQL